MSTERKTYTYTPYTESETVKGVGDKKTTAENAYTTHVNNGFTYSRNDDLSSVLSEILGRKDFSYDLNGDALYQQYKNNYIQQGKMASADVMGQAAAMTGGYGSSYAASVGNQAYQASLQQLNDRIPELYQLALAAHEQKGQDLNTKYGILSDDRNTEYGMWADKGTMLNNDRTYYGTEYNNAYTRDFNEHTVKEGYKYQDIADANSWAAAQKTSNGSYTPPAAPTLDASEYNDVLLNAADYASQSKTALINYLNGMVSRGLSQDEAADILEQYFPPEKPYINPATGSYPRYQGRGIVDMIN